MQDILNAVLPTIENREYEAMTPLTYSTEFCYGYTPGNPPPKKQLVRGEITNSTFMDYLGKTFFILPFSKQNIARSILKATPQYQMEICDSV